MKLLEKHNHIPSGYISQINSQKSRIASIKFIVMLVVIWKIHCDNQIYDNVNEDIFLLQICMKNVNSQQKTS